MRKIFKLKKWFTLEQAASYLSEAFEDEITEADIFQLADDKQLTLSVNFINFTYAALGRLVPVENADLLMAPDRQSLIERGPINQAEIPPEVARTLRKIRAFQQASKTEQAQLSAFVKEKTVIKESAVTTEEDRAIVVDFRGELLADNSGVVEIDQDHTHLIDGVWDIPMLGADQLFIKQNLLNHLNGSELERILLAETYLASEDKQEWAVLRDRKDSLPTCEFPPDSSIVIRTSELQRFIDSFNELPTASPRAADNHLKTIGVLTKALAEQLTIRYGTPEKPNISRIYEEVLSPHIPEDTPGLAKSTVTARIQQGLKLIG